MPRKQETKAVDVLAYFSDAPIDVAELVLQLSKAAVDKRRRPASKQRLSPPAASQAAPIEMPAPKAPPAKKAATPPRTRKKVLAQPALTGEADVPLPGLPGMVPVVGG